MYVAINNIFVIVREISCPCA